MQVKTQTRHESSDRQNLQANLHGANDRRITYETLHILDGADQSN